MAPRCHDLAGVILPQDHFGSHLNFNGENVDEELDEQNFAHAGKIPADILSATVTGGYRTAAEYVDPQEKNEPETLEKSPPW
ncbi:hypothetical protein Hamer_G012382 [Homarus americanus]|uniref:Uncharacterized protein n=1 Tax=Homarus americanus TaxID=6706 RepID=A0A8J5MZW0_HOMAM|nr:hypothetical protein Hamer_G012380 [Homarus americanus]KAG7170140.1 hypothetical protein Hamer_G012382 [Homarus americanus]